MLELMPEGERIEGSQGQWIQTPHGVIPDLMLDPN